MVRKIALLSLFAFALFGNALAYGDELPSYPIELPQKQEWSFSGPFGTYDKAQLQRGLQIYQEVCSTCHGLKYVHFRDLSALGYDDEQIKAFAKKFIISGEINDEGEAVERAGEPTDSFPNPFANEQMAAFVNNGTAPVDLSLIARARHVPLSSFSFIEDVVSNYTTAGPDYIYSYLTGYQDPPEGREIGELNYYNPSFISSDVTNMAPPLSDGMVSYHDGSPETIDQYAQDVSAFLMWTSDPHMEKRKQLGMQVILFLIILSSLCYMLKRSFWTDFKKKEKKSEKP